MSRVIAPKARANSAGSTVESDLIGGKSESIYSVIQGDIGATDPAYSLSVGGGAGTYLGISINFDENLVPNGLSFSIGIGSGEAVSLKPNPYANLASVTTDYNGNMHRGGATAGSQGKN